MQQREKDTSSDKHTQVLLLAQADLIRQDKCLCKSTHTLTQAYKLTEIDELLIVIATSWLVNKF